MAESGYGCVFGDCTAAVVHLHTNLKTGASVTLCGEHNAPGMIPLLAAELGVDPGDFYATIERFIAREAKKADRALADARAADGAQGSEGPESQDGDDVQADDRETFDNDGVTVRVPDTPEGA